MATQRDGPKSRVNPKYLAVLAIVLFGSAAIAGFYSFGMQGTGTTKTTSTTSSATTACTTAAPAVDQQLVPKTFGAITEYTLSPNRTPGGIAVNETDGSVWFGEWGLPGVAHLYQNGTLTEFPWPSSKSTSLGYCGTQTNIWGVVLWNGSVWGSDFFYNRLVGVNPSTGQTQQIELANDTSPYTLAVSSNNYLWFTASKLGAQIGKVNPTDHAVTYYNLPTGKAWESVYILFKNSTVGYVLALDAQNYDTTQVLSFNPTLPDPSFTPIGDNQTLYAPTSLALGEGGLWATEHSASAMAFLNFTTGAWTIFPVSTVPYTPYALTYFDATNGTDVWFNEHYANRMGVIYDNASQLTEYNISNPPVYNLTEITDPTSGINMVTMGIAPDGAWFAASSAQTMGFVSGSYLPPFAISLSTHKVQLAPGGSAQISITLSGDTIGRNLSLQFSDNENYSGTPQQLSFTTPAPIASTVGTNSIAMTIQAASGIQPGTYLAAATVTDGSIYRSVYFTVIVT